MVQRVRERISRYCGGAALLLCCFVGVPSAAAQTANIRLEVDRHLVRVGETVQISVFIDIDGRGGYDQYRPPALKGLRNVGQESTSQSIQVINWRVRRKETHDSMAVAEREGRFSIGPASILIGGRWFRSNVVKVTVRGHAGAAVPPGYGGRPATPPDVAPGGRVPTNPKEVLPSLFIAADLTPQKVYVGQQIIAVWKLYTQSDVSGFRSLKQPTTDGFWSDDLVSPRRLDWQREDLQERTFYAAVLARKALFPQRPGKVTVGEMTALVRAGSFFSRSQQVQSKQVEVEVLPLPKQGRPKGFPEQNVGQFELNASLTRDKVKAGEALTLKVVVRGRGNLRQLSLPTLEATDGLKVYQPKVTDHINNERLIEGEKIVEYVVLPTRAGVLQIPPITLAYFDPSNASYREAKTPSLRLEVSGKIPTAGGVGATSTKNVVGPDDIRPPRAALGSIEDQAPTSPLALHFLLLALIPVIAFGGLLVTERVRAQLSRQTERSLGRAAARRVKEHLAGARRALQEGNLGPGYSQLAAALREQVAHQLDERSEGMTRAELEQRMLERGFDDELVHRLLEELEACDFARFAPSAAGKPELQAAFDRVVEIIRQLGRSGRVRGKKEARA